MKSQNIHIETDFGEIVKRSALKATAAFCPDSVKGLLHEFEIIRFWLKGEKEKYNEVSNMKALRLHLAHEGYVIDEEIDLAENKTLIITKNSIGEYIDFVAEKTTI